MAALFLLLTAGAARSAGLAGAPPIPAASDSAGSAGAASKAVGALRGVITGADDGKPLSFAYVTLVSAATGSRGITVASGPDGRFLAEVPPGVYDVRVSYLLYPPRTFPAVEVEPGRATDLNVALSSRPAVRFAGQVVSARDSTGLGGVSVVVHSLDNPEKVYGAMTGTDGRFEVEVPPGRYSIDALFFMYEKKEIPSHEVYLDGNRTLRIEMTPQHMETREILVEGNAIKHTQVAEIQTRRKAAQVTDGISRDQISRSADADAGQVLKRVTGLSVRDGKYLVVRGLSERYASTQLNGVRIGSPEPNRRVVPLDIFPAGLLDNITIQKAYSPDQPGEFGGGTLQITTREVPDQPVWAQSFGVGLNSETTGLSGLGYKGGHLDFLGIDDGLRSLPAMIRKMAPHQKIVQKSPLRPDGPGFSRDDFLAMARSFNDEWAPRTVTAPVNAGFSQTLGRRFDLFSHPLGLVGSGSYASGYSTSEGDLNFYQDVTLVPKALYRQEKTLRTVLWGGTGTATYRLSDDSSIKAGVFYSRSSDNEARRYQGYNADYDRPFRAERLLFVERSLYAGTLGAEHNLPILGSKLEWKINHSTAHRNEPDRRENGYEEIEVSSPDGGPPDSVWVFSQRGNGATRLFSEVADRERGAEAHLTLPFKSWAPGDARFKIGILDQEKDRSSWTRRFQFIANGNVTTPVDSLITDQNIGSKVNFSETTRGSDFYWADQSIHSIYALVDMPLARQLRILTGVRQEEAQQGITTYSDAIFTSPLKTYGNDDTDLMPALNLTWAAGARTNVRFAASRTVSRPDLRELTRFDLTDYIGGYNETGNPDLKRARITAYDLRWENFPALNELVSASLFFKRIDQPIERTVQGGEAPRFYPQNGDHAINYGTELELRTALARVARRLQRFGVSGNLSLVHTRARVPGSGVQTATRRPMEGQSPYVVNLALFYSTPGSGTELSLFYNRFGRRLTGVGIYGQPDIYELARSSVDLVVSRRVAGSMKIKLTGKNLSNQSQVIEQGGKVRESYAPGLSWSLGISTGS